MHPEKIIQKIKELFEEIKGQGYEIDLEGLIFIDATGESIGIDFALKDGTREEVSEEK